MWQCFELLEKRAMMAADASSAWQNQVNAADVDGDGQVNGLDLQFLVAQLNISGPQQLGSNPAAAGGAAAGAASETAGWAVAGTAAMRGRLRTVGNSSADSSSAAVIASSVFSISGSSARLWR